MKTVIIKLHFHTNHNFMLIQRLALSKPNKGSTLCSATVYTVMLQQWCNNTPERPPEYFTEPHWASGIILWLELVGEDIQNEGRTLKSRYGLMIAKNGCHLSTVFGWWTWSSPLWTLLAGAGQDFLAPSLDLLLVCPTPYRARMVKLKSTQKWLSLLGK